MTGGYDFAISRRAAPEVCIFFCSLFNERAQGRPGARCTRGLACNCAQRTRTRAYRFSHCRHHGRHTRAVRVSSTPRPLDSITDVSGILGRPPSRTMTAGCESAILAALMRPRFALIVSPSIENRGRREDRVRAAPAVSCAIAHTKRAHEHTGSAETLRPSLRSGFTAYFVLSPVNGSFATVVPREALLPRNLTPAPRRQDHTTSPYASHASSVMDRLASTASCRTFVTMAARPLCRRNLAECANGRLSHQPPVAGAEPAHAQRRQSLYHEARDSSGVFLNPNSCKGFEPGRARKGVDDGTR